jgi:uncharacterized protein with gpF-like domain
MARPLTGLSPQREAAFNVRAQAIASRRMEVAVFREVNRAMMAMGREWGNPLRQAEIMAGHREEMQAILTREYNRAFDVFGQRMIDAAAKAHPGRFEKKDTDSLFVRLARAWVISMVAKKVTSIVNTTKAQAMRIIKREVDTGIVEGLGQDAIGRLIRGAFEQEGAQLARARANVIARTETHNAANAAAHEAIRSTGLPIVKTWVTVDDGREREAHRLADGQEQDINAPFIVDGEELQFPGDDAGSAANVINCRCQTAHQVLD